METLGSSDRQEDVANEKALPTPAAGVAAGAQRTVLIVEDDDATRAIYAQLLRLLGYQVEEAAEGRCGIERARAVLPDLILMDIGLPEVSGCAAARLLRADASTAQIPLLAFSATVDSFDALRSIDDAGYFDGFVTKPAAPSELAQRVSACIEAKRSQSNEAAA